MTSNQDSNVFYIVHLPIITYLLSKALDKPQGIVSWGGGGELWVEVERQDA